MTKHKHRVKLGIKLILYTLVSIAVAAGCYIGARAGCDALIDKKIYTKEAVAVREQELFEELLSYLNEKEVTSFSDRDSIEEWMQGQKNLIIAIYNGGQPFGGTDEGTILYSTTADAPAAYEMLQQEYGDYWYTCPVMVQGDFMRSRLVRVMYFPMYTAHRYALYGCAGLSVVAFAVTLLLLVRRKTRYMSVLAREIQTMEGGELSVPMTVRGNDELTTLAENMDKMRLSFLERLAREDEMTRKSSQLLTDMSHDLRTPLTALIGYLDIIQSGRCGEAEKEKQYLSSALKRAYQIKEMTDELFEYFLVYSSEEETVQTESVDAMTLLGQMWDESAFSLESEGFRTEFDPGSESGFVCVNVRMIRRVFDNMVSNIRKYADKAEPIRAQLTLTARGFAFRVSNTVAREQKGESSGIGLASCRKIAALHGGSFESETEGESYTCCLILPREK